MKEILTRSFFGLLYVALLVLCMRYEFLLALLFLVWGVACLNEFKTLIALKSVAPYVVFIVLYAFFIYGPLLLDLKEVIDDATRVLIVLTLVVALLLIRDLFSKASRSLFNPKRFVLTTFYISSAFIFLMLTAYHHRTYNPHILLGVFVIVWTNDSFAYLVGKAFGKQKLFKRISPKKTIEGFLGGLFFSCVMSFLIASYSQTLSFSSWLTLTVIVGVFGTLGDLVESKFKRQANAKDSGNMIPGHGGLLDRLDSIIFAIPFVYLFLKTLQHVS